MPLPDTGTDPPITNSRPKARRSVFVALGWGLACAAWAGCGWPVALVAAFSLLNTTLTPNDLKPRMPEVALGASALGGAFGLLAGALVGLPRAIRDHGTTSLVLALGGAVIGAIGGGLCLPAMLVCDPWLHPLVSSSLAWALAGLLAGLGGYDLSRELAERSKPVEEDEDTDQPQPRVMWVLREHKRSLREWPLYRVLPVLAVSAFSLVGAAILAPSSVALALLAIGLLGLSVAVVLHAQEKRLRRLERRFRPEHDE